MSTNARKVSLISGGGGHDDDNDDDDFDDDTNMRCVYYTLNGLNEDSICVPI